MANYIQQIGTPYPIHFSPDEVFIWSYVMFSTKNATDSETRMKKINEMLDAGMIRVIDAIHYREALELTKKGKAFRRKVRRVTKVEQRRAAKKQKYKQH